MGEGTVRLPLDVLEDHPGNVFRPYTDEELRELAESIESCGRMLAPLVVRPKGDGRYEIISGHQRKRAAALLGWPEVECVVVEADDATAELMLIDANVEARQLTPMELARAVRRKKELLRQFRGDKGGTGFHLFDGKTRDHVARHFGLSGRQADKYDKLNDLIPELQEMVDAGKLSVKLGAKIACRAPEKQRLRLEVLGDEISSLSPDVLRDLEEADRLRAECERGHLALTIIKGRLEEAEAKLRGYEEAYGSKEDLEKEVQRLRAKVRELTYDEIDRKSDLERVDERARRSGAALIELLEQLTRPLAAARAELQHLVDAGPVEPNLAAYGLKLLGVLRETLSLVEPVIVGGLGRPDGGGKVVDVSSRKRRGGPGG